MAKFRMVHTTFWDDPKVVEELTPEDKLFFLYLLTNPNSKQIGICQLTKKQMAFDIGYSPEAINSLMQRFTEYHKLIRYNPETRELAIKNWGRYNLTRGGKPVLDCVRSELKEVKDLSLIEYVSNSIERPEIKALYDSYNDSYHDTSTTSGQEEEEEEDKEKEQEQEKEQEEKAAAIPGQSKNLNEFGQVYQKYEMTITPFVSEPDRTKMFYWLKEYQNLPLTLYAIERTGEKGKKIGFIDYLLKLWTGNGITEVDAAKAFEESNDPVNKEVAAAPKRMSHKERLLSQSGGQ